MPKTQDFVGSKVRAYFKGNMINGIVGDEVQRGNNSMRKWNVSFDDGYSSICGEKKIRSWLIPTKRSLKQIDYILVSHRWLSSVTECRSDWAPSIQRSKWGIKEDHALVRCTWKWRLRNVDPTAGADYSALAIPNTDYAAKFDKEFRRYYLEAEDFIVPPACIWHAQDDFIDSEASEDDLCDDTDPYVIEHSTKQKYAH